MGRIRSGEFGAVGRQRASAPSRWESKLTAVEHEHQLFAHTGGAKQGGLQRGPMLAVTVLLREQERRVERKLALRGLAGGLSIDRCGL
jgi:hypothetical protein